MRTTNKPTIIIAFIKYYKLINVFEFQNEDAYLGTKSNDNLLNNFRLYIE